MTQFYFDQSRKDDPHALPDGEVFYMSQEDIEYESQHGESFAGEGWYYWPCFPGCMPDGEPVGPFKTEKLAIENAQDGE